MAVSPAQTEKVIRENLRMRFGLETKKIFREPRSNNSQIYIVSVCQFESPNITSKQHPSRPGTQPLPSGVTKLVMRFTDPDANLNNVVLVQSEVASMTLARNALDSLSTHIVPHVYDWKDATADEPGWILLEFLPGEPLELGAFKKLDRVAKQNILRQVALVFKSLQQYEVPASVKGYGGLGFAEDGSIVVGPTPIHGATQACDTYHQLYEQYLKTQLAFMDKCDVVRGWRDSDLRERIDHFVTEGFKPLLEQASELYPRQTLVHGDFDLHNLLFDPETHRITGLLDFAFSHIASAADEYFYSFEKIQGLLFPPGVNDTLRHNILHGFDETATGSAGIAFLRDKEFSQAGVQRPVDLMPGIEPLSRLYWFIQNISPGLFFLPRSRARMGPAKTNAVRSHTEDDLGRTYLGPWGY